MSTAAASLHRTDFDGAVAGAGDALGGPTHKIPETLCGGRQMTTDL
jgi:hypothetical protein